MESSEWPNAMMIAIEPISGQIVPLNQPSASLLNCMFFGTGSGGSCALPCSSRVMGHQIRKATTMTVVICMMRSALPLDSWMPRDVAAPEVGRDQHAESGGEKVRRNARRNVAGHLANSFSRWPRYSPALTTLMGPVRM